MIVISVYKLFDNLNILLLIRLVSVYFFISPNQWSQSVVGHKISE